MEDQKIIKSHQRSIYESTNKVGIICPKCKSVNTMEDFCVIKHVMHEKCSKCGFIQKMSIDRCLKDEVPIHNIVPNQNTYNRCYKLL